MATIASTAPASPSRSLHLPGLDTIRFLSALMVVYTHTGLPYLGGFFDQLGIVGKISRAMYATFLNGQGAVMVFFVVSGLCIHLPQTGRGAPHWISFLVRRYIRLGIPLAAAFTLGPLLHSRIFGGTNPVKSVWWSLIAEMVYYTLYPGLFWAAARIGWNRILAVSATISLVLFAVHSDVGHPAKFGRLGTSLVYLPAWILGCLLAERIGAGRLPALVGARRWAWRAAVVGSLMASNALIHHCPFPFPPVRFPVSVLGVAVVAWLWLPRELAWCRQHPPPAWLEWCGAWSYSLYLTHLNWFDLWKRGAAYWKFLEPYQWAEIGIRSLFIIGMTIGFYFVVEAPSHRLARMAAQLIDRWRGQHAIRGEGAGSS